MSKLARKRRPVTLERLERAADFAAQRLGIYATLFWWQITLTLQANVIGWRMAVQEEQRVLDLIINGDPSAFQPTGVIYAGKRKK